METENDIICDSCGKSCGVPINVPKNGEEPCLSFEYMTLKAHWGYGSHKDLENYEAHLCEECVDKKLNFINFKKTEYDIYDAFSNSAQL